jgi:hypothetical protein
MRKKALFLLWLLPAVSFSQQSTLPRDKDSDLRQAFELFDKEKLNPYSLFVYTIEALSGLGVTTIDVESR